MIRPVIKVEWFVQKAAQVLGVIASVFALLGALYVIAMGGNQLDTNPSRANDTTRDGGVALVLTVLGLAGATAATKERRKAAVFMVIAAFGLFYFIGGFAFLPLVLYLIAAGLVAFGPSPQTA